MSRLTSDQWPTSLSILDKSSKGLKKFKGANLQDLTWAVNLLIYLKQVK